MYVIHVVACCQLQILLNYSIPIMYIFIKISFKKNLHRPHTLKFYKNCFLTSRIYLHICKDILFCVFFFEKVKNQWSDII